MFVTAIIDDRAAFSERIAGGFGLTPEDALESPHVLVGTVGQIVETLQQRREQFGFSYIVFSGDLFEQTAPIVKRLAGT